MSIADNRQAGIHSLPDGQDSFIMHVTSIVENTWDRLMTQKSNSELPLTNTQKELLQVYFKSHKTEVAESLAKSQTTRFKLMRFSDFTLHTDDGVWEMDETGQPMAIINFKLVVEQGAKTDDNKAEFAKAASKPSTKRLTIMSQPLDAKKILQKRDTIPFPSENSGNSTGVSLEERARLDPDMLKFSPRVQSALKDFATTLPSEFSSISPEIITQWKNRIEVEANKSSSSILMGLTSDFLSVFAKTDGIIIHPHTQIQLYHSTTRSTEMTLSDLNLHLDAQIVTGERRDTVHDFSRLNMRHTSEPNDF